MIEKLLDLGYKRVRDFDDKGMRENLEYFTSGRANPIGSDYYAKVVEQRVLYEMDDGSRFENRVSLNIILLADEAENGMLDCFCVPPYPFELKTEGDFDALANLYNVYRSDLKELMEYEKKHPSDA